MSHFPRLPFWKEWRLCSATAYASARHTEDNVFQSNKGNNSRSIFSFVMINSMGSLIHFHLDSGVLFQPLLSWTTTILSTYSKWPILCSVRLATSFCEFFLQCYSQIQDVQLCIFFFITSWNFRTSQRVLSSTVSGSKICIYHTIDPVLWNGL